MNKSFCFVQKFLIGCENNSASISISQRNILGMLIGRTSQARFCRASPAFSMPRCTGNLSEGSVLSRIPRTSFDQGFPVFGILPSTPQSPPPTEVSLHTPCPAAWMPFPAADSQPPVLHEPLSLLVNTWPSH